MDQVAWISAGSALLGGLIGSIGSVAVIWLQQRAESRRERMRMALQLAMHEYDKDLEQAKARATALGRTIPVMPIATYVDYHARTIELLAGGRATPEQVRAAYRSNLEIIETVRAASEERHEMRKGVEGQRP